MNVRVKRLPGTEHMLRIEILLDKEEYAELGEALSTAIVRTGHDKSLVMLLDKLPFPSELP